MTTIDSHQHLWDPGAVDYPWLGPQHSPVDGVMTFDELRPQLRAAGVDATVLVQSADNDADTDAMVAAADENPEIAAIVAYVPLDDPDRAAARLAELRRDSRIVGVRTLIHEIPDPDWLLGPVVDRGLGVLEDAGVSFDLVAVLPRHLENLATISERHPRLRIVIDHLAKPPIGGDDTGPWWSLIETAAQNPLVTAKVSGLYSSVGAMGDWTLEGIRPFFDRALDVFGAERLMYGGDWPISVLAGGYERVWGALSALVDELPAHDRDRIRGGTAAEFYRIDPERLRLAAAAMAAG
jgi:L-fuconolactonase